MTKLPRYSGGVPAAGGKASDVEKYVQAAPMKEAFPWNATGVRDDLRVELNTRQSERLMLQIKWLASKQARPLRDLVEDALSEYFKRETKVLGINA